MVDAGGYVIGFLTQKALLYYLPVILKGILSDEKPWTDTIDRSFGIFLYEDSARKLLSVLTGDQIDTLTSVLRYVGSKTENYTKECAAFLQLRRERLSNE